MRLKDEALVPPEKAERFSQAADSPAGTMGVAQVLAGGLNKQPFVGVNSELARRGRLDFLDDLGFEVEGYKTSQLSANEVKGNIESFLGSMTLPVGLVGPLLYRDAEGQCSEVFTAAATTEGALVASMNRGVSVLNQAGGFKAHVQWQRMLRAPMFCFKNIGDALVFREWVAEQFDQLVSYVKEYSSHTVLVDIKTELMGKNLMCQFYYETGDASGQNMTTICTWKVCAFLERAYGGLYPGAIQDFILDCNGSGDKKLSYDSILNGRGMNVVAECYVSENILRRKLKTSSKMMMAWYTRSTYVAQAGGMVGYNVNVANVIAAVFAATGQDLACVHESSVAYLYFEPHQDGLYACIKLPRLVVATVGGGTSLPYQNANLELMGCAGGGKVKRFAEVLAGICLGLELSTFAAMANGQFAIAHERLGRNKPLKKIAEDMSFAEALQVRLLKDRGQNLRMLHRLEESNGILTEITAQTTSKALGLSVWEVLAGEQRALALLKSKPTDAELLNCMYVLTGLIDPHLAQVFDGYKDRCDFRHAHLKETCVYDGVASDHMPQVYGTLCDLTSESYLILMELLETADFRLINSELSPDSWDVDSVMAVIRAAFSLQKSMAHLAANPMFAYSAAEDYVPFGRQALSVLKDEYGADWNAFFSVYDASLQFLDSVDELKLPKAVVHNDFNPRNVAVSHDGRVVVYDFELARVDVPHRDPVEFISFIYSSIAEDFSLDDLIVFVGDELDESPEETRYYLKFALAKYVVTRMSLYLLGHRVTQYPFLSQVGNNCVRLGRELGLS